jgi:hypothetical protein
MRELLSVMATHESVKILLAEIAEVASRDYEREKEELEMFRLREEPPEWDLDDELSFFATRPPNQLWNLLGFPCTNESDPPVIPGMALFHDPAKKITTWRGSEGNAAGKRY